MRCRHETPGSQRDRNWRGCCCPFRLGGTKCQHSRGTQSISVSPLAPRQCKTQGRQLKRKSNCGDAWLWQPVPVTGIHASVFVCFLHHSQNTCRWPVCTPGGCLTSWLVASPQSQNFTAWRCAQLRILIIPVTSILSPQGTALSFQFLSFGDSSVLSPPLCSFHISNGVSVFLVSLWSNFLHKQTNAHGY